MEINLDKRFGIDAPVAAAWAVLQDIKGVAECMPGAEITERVDDSHYKGQVRVKLGPAAATFKGELHVEAVDPEKRTLTLIGRGAEMKGGSAANMHLVAQVHEVSADKSELTGNAKVTVSGKMASFGGRMMTQVADQVIKQFGDNLVQRVQAQGTAAGAANPPPRRELNAFALLWRTLLDLLRPRRRSKSPTSR